jgi:hypothetical protein
LLNIFNDCFFPIAALVYYNNAIDLQKGIFPEALQNAGHIYDQLGEFNQSLNFHRLSVVHARSIDFKISAIVNVVLVELKLMKAKGKDELQRLIALLGNNFQFLNS